VAVVEAPSTNKNRHFSKLQLSIERGSKLIDLDNTSNLIVKR
jgi:hypothetical protein